MNFIQYFQGRLIISTHFKTSTYNFVIFKILFLTKSRLFLFFRNEMKKVSTPKNDCVNTLQTLIETSPPHTYMFCNQLTPAWKARDFNLLPWRFFCECIGLWLIDYNA